MLAERPLTRRFASHSNRSTDLNGALVEAPPSLPFFTCNDGTAVNLGQIEAPQRYFRL